MEITTVSSSYQKKWNLGDYESVEAGASMYAKLEQGEDPAVAEDMLFDQCKQAVNKAVQEDIDNNQYQQNKARLKRTVMGQTVPTNGNDLPWK